MDRIAPRAARQGRIVAPAVIALSAALAAGPPTGAADAAPVADAARSARGALEVRIDGLPSGQRPVATLRGPGLRRELRAARTTVRRLRPGRYVLTLRRVTFARGSRAIAKGSIALPSRRRATVRLRRGGGRTQLRAGYGIVMRAGAQRAPRRVTAVLGAPEDPSGLVLPPGGARHRVGGYLTSGPTPDLPHGLIARVTRVRTERRRVVLGLRSVPVTEVVPEFHGWAQRGARAAALGSHTVGREPDVGSVLRFTKSLPCRLDSDVRRSPGPGLEMGLRRPRLEQLEWSVLRPRLHVRTSGEWFVGWTLNPGDALRCSETLAGFTQIVPVPIGPLVVPFFFGAKIAAKAAMTQTGARASVDHAVALTLDMDTARGPLNWLEQSAAPQTRVDGQVALDLQASAGFYVEAGVGAPRVANARFEIGPELVLEAPADGTCQAQAKLSAKLIAELVVQTFTLDAGSKTFLGPIALPGCRAVDPILGDWRYADGGGDLRIEQAAGGGFQARALTPNTVDGSACLHRPVGTTFAIAGADGAYTAPYSWWRLPDCVQTDADPAARMFISAWNRDEIEFCGSTPRNSGCDTLTRIRVR
ncbi:MAG TPA: hypothetical protein VLK58_22480 [Conexibacter sp.]|nr:hypothetical protein [Conexibacter sp.]